MEKILEPLRWRYAVKQYDISRKLGDAEMAVLQEAIRLAPSSFGLQPYRVLLVENDVLRERLRAVSYGQSQITEAACLVVFAIENFVDERYVDAYFRNLCDMRGVALEGRLMKHRDSVARSIRQMSDIERRSWATQQAYLGLGFLLFAAAQMGIDANPMEGFQSAAYDDLLGLGDKGLSSVVIAALGFRDAGDTLQSQAKVRKSADSLFIHL